MKWKPKKEYKVIQGTKLVETNEESGIILKNSGVKHNRWNLVKLGDVVKINPRRKLTRTREAVHVAMRDIEGHKRETTSHSYKKFSGSGARFQNGDTLFARITPCLENGKTAYVSCLKPNQVAHGSTEFIVLSGIEGKTDNLFVYYLARDPNLRAFAIHSMQGSTGRQRVMADSVRSTGKYNPEQVIISGECVVSYTDVTQEAEVVGKPAIVRGDEKYQTLVASLDLGIIRPLKSIVSIWFLYCFFQERHFQFHIYGYADGTTVLHLTKDGVPNYQFALLPEKIRCLFDLIAEPLFAKIESNENESRTLAQIRDTLLPKLLSGEIRVDDAAEILEGTHMPQRTVPHIESLHVKNYRALRDIELKQLKPLTVFLGANGSGKSTLFDVFAFLSECFTIGLRQACNKRGGLKELRTRGCDGPIEFELKYREEPKSPIITYHLSIDEGIKGLFVDTELMKWRPSSRGKHIRFLDFHRSVGSVIAGETPDEENKQIDERLDDPSALAANMFGQLARHPRNI